MIVTQAEIDLVNGKMRRRMMRLPVLRGQAGEREPCPAQRGRTYQLQTRTVTKGQAAITVIEDPRIEKLAALSLQDARREGHATVQGAIDAYTLRHGPCDESTLVWVVSFAKDNKDREVAAVVNQADPLFMGRQAGYTTSKSHAAPGEPEVMMPFEKDLAEARKKATERRLTPQQEAAKRLGDDVETLREAMTNMKGRELLRLARRSIRAAERELLSDGSLHSASSAVLDGSQGEADRPPHGAPLPCPDARAAA